MALDIKLNKTRKPIIIISLIQAYQLKKPAKKAFYSCKYCAVKP